MVVAIGRAKCRTGFDKIAGSDFERCHDVTAARRVEGRMPGITLAAQPIFLSQ
jgi:hypothetical protein